MPLALASSRRATALVARAAAHVHGLSALGSSRGGLLLSTRFSSAAVTSGSAPLFACGSNDEASADTLQVISVFNVAKTVCCDQLHEQCDKSSTLPLSCDSSSCARVVDLVEQSCKAAFADGFLRSAFKPQLDPLITTCNAATKGWKDPYPVYVV